tara:strand:+ start:4382 stop:4624 length:243 start_codon:yes stop_codon:yes gene_type:complete
VKDYKEKNRRFNIMDAFFYLHLFFLTFICLLSIKLYFVLVDFIYWIKKDSLNSSFTISHNPPIPPKNFKDLNLSKYEMEE